MEEYPIGTLVVTEVFEEGDEITEIRDCKIQTLVFYPASAWDVKNISGKGKTFLKHRYNSPSERMIKPVTPISRNMPLKEIPDHELFRYQTRIYKKGVEVWNARNCPKYLGNEDPTCVTHAVYPMLADNKFSNVLEQASWMNINTIVELLK